MLLRSHHRRKRISVRRLDVKDSSRSAAKTLWLVNSTRNLLIVNCHPPPSMSRDSVGSKWSNGCSRNLSSDNAVTSTCVRAEKNVMKLDDKKLYHCCFKWFDLSIVVGEALSCRLTRKINSMCWLFTLFFDLSRYFSRQTFNHLSATFTQRNLLSRQAKD